MQLARWLGRPFFGRRTVRLRMTVSYGGLFLLSGAVMLAIASGFATVSSTSVAPASNPGAADVGSGSAGALAQADRRIRHLQVALANAQHSGQPSVTHQLLVGSLIALAVMAAASAVVGWLMAGHALRPLRVITATARRISEDNLHERLSLRGPRDELKDLADTFDGLLERLDAAFTAQRLFVANASHELRTPLATMRASLDVALAKPGPPPPQTVALAGRLRAELDRVDALLEGFLVLARAQHGAPPGALPGEDVADLADIVGAAVIGKAAAAERAGLTVRQAGGAPAHIAGSRPLLRRMVDNVLENAIVHNEPAGWIAVGTWTGPDTVRIIVENGGRLLDQAQVSELAQPFRRLGADRTGSDRGSGLGLSIVAAIATAHSGSVDLQARADGGLRVVIELPLVSRAAGRRALAGVPG
jgi:signal transduction histidine kinase